MPSINYHPLATQEHPAPDPNPSDTHRLPKSIDRKLAVWTILNILTSLLAILLLSSTTFHTQPPLTPPAPPNETLHSPLTFFPPFATTTLTFANTSSFQSTTAAGDTAWQQMLPPGSGALRIPYPRRFDLPPSALRSNDSSASEAYAASVTHQLHCLAMVRDVVVASITGRARRETDASADRHIVHCLDYVRQGILCAGDTTLEEFKAVKDAEGLVMSYFIDGMGARHRQCRDWGAVREFLERNRFMGAEEAGRRHGS